MIVFHLSVQEGMHRVSSQNKVPRFPGLSHVFHLKNMLPEICLLDKPFEHLLGGIPTPLKNMIVSWDYYSQYMEKNMFQTTNQTCLARQQNVQQILHNRRGDAVPSISTVAKFLMTITWINCILYTYYITDKK